MLKHLCFLLCFFPAVCFSDHNLQTVRLATTTSVDNSGLLDYLMPFFNEKYDYQLDIKVVGSGEALRLGRKGLVDLVWVHSPLAEERFIRDGSGDKRAHVMTNNFVLAGPVTDPLGIKGGDDVLLALKGIANSSEGVFVSRGDDSGTHRKELLLWQQAGIEPYGAEWYYESGMGMARTLKYAANIKAYLVVDNATFQVHKPIDYAVIVEDEKKLKNPYSVIAVKSTEDNDVNHQGAVTLINWLVSKQGQQRISSFKKNGTQLYKPSLAAELLVEE